MNDLNHLAIIMDGNGRWAKSKGFLRTNGHEAGANIVEMVARVCIKECVKNLTLFAFSTENWNRPKSEVEFLMKLFKKFLISSRAKFMENGICFDTIGDLSAFDLELRNLISDIKNSTKNNLGLNLVLAINYGGKAEIVSACKDILASGDDIDEKSLGKFMQSSKFGDVDLLIRTGGEKRISNFMLWSIAYAELEFSDTFWPEFSESELENIICKYKHKHRRFGGL